MIQGVTTMRVWPVFLVMRRFPASTLEVILQLNAVGRGNEDAAHHHSLLR